MRRLLIVVGLALAVPLAAASDVPLASIHSIYVEAADDSKKDDLTLAACVSENITAKRPQWTLTTSKDDADAIFHVGSRPTMRIHVLVSVIMRDGTKALTVNHVTHGLNHSLCHQADGLLDELVRAVNKARDGF